MEKNKNADISVNTGSKKQSGNKFSELIKEDREPEEEKVRKIPAGEYEEIAGNKEWDTPEEYEEPDEVGSYESDDPDGDYDGFTDEEPDQNAEAPEEDRGDKKFYKGLLIAFASGLVVIIIILSYLWLLLKDYEACLPDNLVSEIMENYPGSDKYFYEDTVKDSGMKRFRIQDGDKRVATVFLEPVGLLTGFDHQKYRVLYVQDERDHTNDIMQIVQVFDITEQENEADQSVRTDEAGTEDASEEPSLPMTEDEENAIRSLAESYVKVYAPFSTIKDIGDLRSKVLSFIKPDTNLYERLKSYHNEWGQNVNGYDFGETTVLNIKKTGEKNYECDVESEFRTSSADWGVKRSYDLTYHMEMEDVDGTLLLTSVE